MCVNPFIETDFNLELCNTSQEDIRNSYSHANLARGNASPKSNSTCIKFSLKYATSFEACV